MRIRYTRLALDDLDQARRFIANDDPEAANIVAGRIEQAHESLLQFPERGRPGRIAGTRELVVTRTPFVVTHRLIGDDIDTLAVIHGRRAWPDSL